MLGALLFNAGCNEQVFSPEKIWHKSVLTFLKKMQKNTHLISKNDVNQPKARECSNIILRFFKQF